MPRLLNLCSKWMRMWDLRLGIAPLMVIEEEAVEINKQIIK
jgi:hypothetical protein